MKNFEDFISSLKIDAKEKYNEFENSQGTGAPKLLKTSLASEKSFNYSIDFSIYLIEEYHRWLTENFDIQPKK